MAAMCTASGRCPQAAKRWPRAGPAGLLLALLHCLCLQAPACHAFGVLSPGHVENDVKHDVVDPVVRGAKWAWKYEEDAMRSVCSHLGTIEDVMSTTTACGMAALQEGDDWDSDLACVCAVAQDALDMTHKSGTEAGKLVSDLCAAQAAVSCVKSLRGAHTGHTSGTHSTSPHAGHSGLTAGLHGVGITNDLLHTIGSNSSGSSGSSTHPRITRKPTSHPRITRKPTSRVVRPLSNYNHTTSPPRARHYTKRPTRRPTRTRITRKPTSRVVYHPRPHYTKRPTRRPTSRVVYHPRPHYGSNYSHFGRRLGGTAKIAGCISSIAAWGANHFFHCGGH